MKRPAPPRSLFASPGRWPSPSELTQLGKAPADWLSHVLEEIVNMADRLDHAPMERGAEFGKYLRDTVKHLQLLRAACLKQKLVVDALVLDHLLLLALTLGKRAEEARTDLLFAPAVREKQTRNTRASPVNDSDILAAVASHTTQVAAASHVGMTPRQLRTRISKIRARKP